MENPMKTDDLGVPPLMETRIDWVDDYEMEWDLYEHLLGDYDRP